MKCCCVAIAQQLVATDRRTFHLSNKLPPQHQRLPWRLLWNAIILITLLNMADSKAIWSVEMTSTLIELYCLYNIKNSTYHNRDKKKRLFRRLATALGIKGKHIIYNYFIYI